MIRRIIIATLVLMCIVPYTAKADTTLSERIYILSSIWKEISNNFAFPEKFKETNPDSLYRCYLTKVLNAESEQEFSDLMTQFMAHFNEGHTRFNDSNIIRYRVPLILTWAGDKLLITNTTRQLKPLLPVGSEIKKVDGLTLDEYLQKHVYPYVSAPNMEWRKRKALDIFLTGKEGAEFHIEITTPKGKTINTKLMTSIRNYDDTDDWSIRRDTAKCSIKKLPGNIMYMKMSTFTLPGTIKSAFENNLSDFLSAKGVIFDIRGNRGGTDESWHNIIRHIADRNTNIFDGLKIMTRVANTAYEMYGKNVSQLADYYNGVAMQPVQEGWFVMKNNTPDSLRITAPVIILVDGFTASAAEDFAATMKNLSLGKIVGTPTAGVISSPKFCNWGHGYSSLIAECRFTNPDGSDIINTGIQPDVCIEYTESDALGKTDSALTAALKMLKGKK